MVSESDQAIFLVWSSFEGLCAQSGGIPTIYDDSDPIGFLRKFPPTLEPVGGRPGQSETAVAAISPIGQVVGDRQLLKVTVKVQARIMNMEMNVRNAKTLSANAFDGQGRRIGGEDVSVVCWEM